VFDAIANDDKQADELFGFILDVASNAKPHLVENGCVYFWSPSMTPSLMILYALIQAGFHMQSQIVWVKNQFILGRCDYHWQHELCWYGYQGTNHKWYGGRTQSSVWNIDKDSHSAYKHPTQKPVALAERAINNSSDRENIVVDLFGGSGSTLIACESLKRRCFMMELDPIYCQVIIDRFEKYTGQKAVKI
jgi:DNA modification methylase